MAEYVRRSRLRPAYFPAITFSHELRSSSRVVIQKMKIDRFRERILQCCKTVRYAGGKGEWRPWDVLLPELLEQIFKYCSIQDKLIIRSVCKSWGRVVDDSPSTWEEIDIKDWCLEKIDHVETRDVVLIELIKKSSGSLKKLCACCVQESTFSFIASHSNNLQNLKIPFSFIRQRTMIREAPKFANLRVLDVSYCRLIGAPALEAIGKHCKYLTELHKNMAGITKEEFDDGALAIASTMPKLKHLEITNKSYFYGDGLMKILSCCNELEFLCIEGSCFVGPWRPSSSMRMWILSVSEKHGRKIIVAGD